MNYLLDVFTFDPEGLSLNATVLLWPQNINPVFDENDEVNIHIFISDTTLCEKAMLRLQGWKYW